MNDQMPPWELNYYIRNSDVGLYRKRAFYEVVRKLRDGSELGIEERQWLVDQLEDPLQGKSPNDQQDGLFLTRFWRASVVFKLYHDSILRGKRRSWESARYEAAEFVIISPPSVRDALQEFRDDLRLLHQEYPTPLWNVTRKADSATLLPRIHLIYIRDRLRYERLRYLLAEFRDLLATSEYPDHLVHEKFGKSAKELLASIDKTLQTTA